MNFNYFFLGSRDLGYVTQEMNKLKIVLRYSNPEIISFQMIYGFFYVVNIFLPQISLQISKCHFKFWKMPKSWHSKGLRIDYCDERLFY